MQITSHGPNFHQCWKTWVSNTLRQKWSAWSQKFSTETNDRTALTSMGSPARKIPWGPLCAFLAWSFHVSFVSFQCCSPNVSKILTFISCEIDQKLSTCATHHHKPTIETSGACLRAHTHMQICTKARYHVTQGYGGFPKWGTPKMDGL